MDIYYRIADAVYKISLPVAFVATWVAAVVVWKYIDGYRLRWVHKSGWTVNRKRRSS